MLAVAAIAAVSVHSVWEQSRYPSLVNERFLRALPAEDHSNIDTFHLQNGLTPPTNKWFSGLALQATPHTVFPLPLSFRPSETAFEVGLPEVAVDDNIILGPHVAMVRAEIANAATYQVVRYDELSVDLAFTDSDDRQIGTVTVTAGSPYIFFTAAKDTTLHLQYDSSASSTRTEASVQLGTKTLKVASFNRATLTEQYGRLSASVPKGAHLTIYALPHQGTEAIIKEHAGNRITGAEISYTKKDQSYLTTIAVKTANNQPTVLGFLPHHHPRVPLLTSEYQTIYGQMKMATGNSFIFSTPEIPIQPSLDLKNLSHDDRLLLTETLRRDINTTHFAAQDTYFGGKSLYRAAQLLDLANQLGEPQLAASIHKKLASEFDAWFSADSHADKYFYYNPKIRGIVGSPPAFGSEAFNDHHFHYGYFIYAASILARYDKTFLERHADAVHLLVADIANYRNDPAVPLRRNFDPYFGHAWASGPAPFNDGNNQESSSEAITAWVAIGLWANQTGNTKLHEHAAWILSNEVAAADAYWLYFDTQAPPYNHGYQPPLVSLNWGGKREHATFFSQEPNAMLGIQLIPMNPTMNRSNIPADRIHQNVQAAVQNNSYHRQFGDYILMYEALADNSKQLLPIARSLPDEYVDGANSRSYLYAWLMTTGSRRQPAN